MAKENSSPDGVPTGTTRAEPPQAREVLLLAATLGLLTGLVEALGLLVLQQRDLLPWFVSQLGISVEIVWISMAFDFLLFLLLGLGVIVAGRTFPQLNSWRFVFFLFGFFLFYDWLALSGRIQSTGTVPLAIGLAVVLMRWWGKRPESALSFRRKTLPWLAAAGVLAFVGIEGGLWLQERQALARLPDAPAGAPNILVLVVDTLRADHLSLYGYTRPTSPNLDRFAAEGVLFEDAISTSSWTLPAHASMLTGLYPYEHNARRRFFDSSAPRLSEVLRDHGYRTGAFSGNTIVFTRRRGFGRGFIRFEDYFGSVADMAARTLYGRKFYRAIQQPLGYDDIPGRKRAADVNRAFLRWAAQDSDRPFFAFLNYFDVHDPYVPPQPYRSKFSEEKSPGGRLNEYVGNVRMPMTPENLKSERDAYDGAIAYVDDQIGKLLAELDRRGWARNTIVVIASDHGESFGEHGLVLHRNALYRELVRVPLVIRWPGRVPAGVRFSEPVSLVALPATLMDLIGESQQEVFRGPSLTLAWKAPGSVDWPNPLAELAQFPFSALEKNPSYSGWLKSLVTPRWQYIFHETRGGELYDVVADPGERENLAKTPEGRPVAREIAGLLREQLPEPLRAKIYLGD